MFKKTYLFLTLLTALLLGGTGLAWGDPVEITPESPYTNGFDTETSYGTPSGWTKVAGTSYYPSVDSKSNIQTRNSSARGLVFMGYSADGQMVLALPEFSDDIKYLTLEFYYKSKGSSYPATMSVGYTTSLTDKTQYHSVQTISYYTDGFTKVTVDYSTVTPAIPDGAYIAFSFAGTGTSSKKGALYIDDVTVTTSYVAPTGGCAKPKNLTKSDDTPEGATFTWEQNTDETTYQWACVASGEEVTSWNTLEENVRTKTITGLTAGTAYDFHVRSYCGAGEGEQSASAKSTFTPTCPAPTAPVVSGISATEATLSWTAAAGISNYQYIVVASGAAQDWTSPTLVEGGATAATLTGLNPSTNHDVYVRSYYSATTQSAAVKASFQTACGAVAIPFTWDFSSMGCWTTYNCNSSSGISSGAFSFHWDNPGQYLISPEFVALSGTVDVTFDYKIQSTTYPETFALGYSTTTSDIASFTWLSDETVNNTTYAQYEKTLPAGVKYIAIQCKSNQQYYLYIDNFSIAATPACPAPTITASNVIYNAATINCAGGSTENKWKLQYKATGDADWTDANGGTLIAAASFDLTGLTPGTAYQAQAQAECAGAWSTAVAFTPTCVTPSGLNVSAKTTTTATIGWTVNSGEAEWNLQYKKASDADWTTVAGVTANPYLLEGLTSGTTYQVRVAATCNGTYTSAASFDTECDTKSAPLDENFNDLTALPACWNFAGATSTMSVSTGTSWLSLENKALFFSGSGGAYAYAILPEMNVEWNTLQIAFSHREESSKGGNIELGYYEGGAFTALTSYSNQGSTMQAESAYSLAAIPNGARAAFAYKPASSGYAGAVDDIHVSVYVAPTCEAPTALAVSEIASTSAKVTWSSEASEFALEYKKTSDEDWTAATGTIASPFTLSGLAANETEYTVRVQAICGETPSAWVELATPFKTECVTPTVTELAAWNENFESQASDKKPACWSEVSSYAISAYTQVNASAAKDGSLGLQVYAYGTNTEIALLPVFETEIKNLKISFDYKNQGDGSRYAALEVGYYSGSTFTNVTTLAKTTTFAASGEIEMPKTAPDGARIAFRVVGAYSGYNGSAYIDNISVIRKPACAVPTITAATATSDGALITWTPGDEESAWNLRYSVKDADTWTVVEDVTTGYAITGMTVGTTYEVQVQANCGGTQSAWTASTEFTPVCNAPSALAVTARTQNSASFSWTSSEHALVLQYSTDGENWESENVAANPFTLNGLSAGQTYQAKIQSACGSTFSNVVEFTTWCDSKLSLPVELTSFSAIPACWEVSPAGAVEVANSKLCFVGEGEKFIYLPQTDVNLNLLSATFTFSGSLEFGYIDAPNGAFHAFASQPTSDVELNLEDEAADAKYIAIRYNGASNLSQASISAVSIRKTPTCAKLDAPTATPGAGSATITWTAGSENAWNLQYKLASAADWTDATGTIASPYELSNLEQGVSYKVRVQANCGEELGDWSEEASFVTDCEGIATLPWYTDFSVALSNCWTIYAQDETYYKPIANTAMNELKLDGGKAGASNNVVVLPAFSASLTNAVLSFEYYGSTGAGYAQLEAGYMGDKDDANTFQALETLEQAGSYTEARVALATVPANKYLAFRVAGANSQTDMRVKNLRVICSNSC